MRFYPEEYLKQVMPKRIIKNGLLYDDLTLKKTYLQALARAAVIDERQLNESVYKTIAQYEAKAQSLQEAGVKAYMQEALQDETLLTQRVKNLLVFDKIQQLKDDHSGEQYRWLPSSAQTPDPEHQLLYGKIFNVGEGDKDGNMPGERFGCQCGIEFIGNPAKEKILEGTDEDFINASQNMFFAAKFGGNLSKIEDLSFGRVNQAEAEKLQRTTGLNLLGYRHKITAADLRHIYLQHGKEIKEALRGQTAVKATDIALIPAITKNPDSISLSAKRAGNGQQILIYRKKIGNEYYYLEGVGNKKNKTLNPKTMYIKKRREN